MPQATLPSRFSSIATCQPASHAGSEPEQSGVADHHHDMALPGLGFESFFDPATNLSAMAGLIRVDGHD